MAEGPDGSLVLPVDEQQALRFLSISEAQERFSLAIKNGQLPPLRAEFDYLTSVDRDQDESCWFVAPPLGWQFQGFEARQQLIEPIIKETPTKPLRRIRIA